MTYYAINFLKSQVLLRLLIFLFIFSIFFPVHYTFLTPEAYLTGQYSDFTSYSLYLSDILLLLIFSFIFIPRAIPRGRAVLLQIKGLRPRSWSFILHNSYFIILVFWLILNLIYHYKSFSGLNAYFFIKWLEFVFVAYGTYLAIAKSDNLRVSGYVYALAKIFLLFTSIQSILALLQFAKQASLGLYKLGESHLAPNIDGVAKLLLNGEAYIRGYGTFPHPNVLSAFLLVGVILSSYFYLNSSKKGQLYYSLAIFLNILGLTATFSRGAFVSLTIGLTFYFSYLFLTKFSQKKLFWLGFVLIFSILISFITFRPFLLTRATISDTATKERAEYSKIAFKMIKSNPIFGVGIGESVLHMQQYSPKTLEPWEKQPIHNYFLLSAAELGIPGMLILILIFISHLKSAFKSSLVTRNQLLVTILGSCLVLMLFDHYFYTLQQTQLLLWIILGLIISAQTKKETVVS